MRMLYHLWLSPGSRKVRLALAEKGLEFSMKVEKTWERRPEFLALNPAGEVPVLVEADELRQVERQKFESEDRYRQIFEKSPETIILLDPQGRIVDINQRGVYLSRYSARSLFLFLRRLRHYTQTATEKQSRLYINSPLRC